METLSIIIITLLVYWTIGTIMIIISDENEKVILAFAVGAIGGLWILIVAAIRKLLFYFKYRYNKRSIVIEVSTGKLYKCKTKDTDDIIHWVSDYQLFKRYSFDKQEWKDLPDFSKEFIEKSKRNCDHCKYDKECLCDFPYDKVKCKHNEYGVVIEFDKFEKGGN
jgi:hypothetical protein